MKKNRNLFGGLFYGLKCSLLCGLLFSLPAMAVVRAAKISDLHHTSWGVADGLPGEVFDIAQTKDGYLWVLTTADGPYRFDGLRFESLAAVCQCEHDDVTDTWIHAAPSGGLWIGSGREISRFQNGQISHVRVSPECGTTLKMVEDLDGNIWFPGRLAVCALRTPGEVGVVATPGRPNMRPDDIFCDSRGTVWIKGADSHLYFRLRGESTFHMSKSGSAEGDLGYRVERTIGQTADGRLWNSGNVGLRPINEGAEDVSNRALQFPLETSGRRKPARLNPLSSLRAPLEGWAILGDREGALWLAVNRGLLKINFPTALIRDAHEDKDVSAFGLVDGLSSDAVYCLFEDREGNMWAGTTSGLDRFSAPIFHKAPFSLNQRIQGVIGVGDHGAVFAGNQSTRLAELSTRGIHTFSTLREKNIVFIHQSPDHTIWVARPSEMWKKMGTEFVRVAYPFPWQDTAPVGMGDTSDGALWVSFTNHGVYRLFQGKWRDENPTLHLSEKTSAMAFGTDQSGTLWIAGPKKLFEYRDGKTNQYALPELPAYNWDLQAYGKHIWLGGFQLSLLVDRKVHVIHGENGEKFKRVSGVVELPTGDVWFNYDKGAALIRAEEIRRTLEDPAHQVSFREFGSSDGLDGSSNLSRPPSARLGEDGRIWMATNKGVFWIDPQEYYEQRAIATSEVAIETLKSTSESFLAQGSPEFKPNPSNLEIRYTALNLAVPEKTQFKYRLLGVDREWQMVGTRRQAYYNKLSPGRYTFRVVARNIDGVWSNKPTEFSFRVLPAYYQTWWFTSLVVIFATIIVWFLFHAQMERSKAEVRGRLSARLQERERIARELHDTLLQGFHGLMFRFQAVSEMLETSDSAGPMLNDALDKADALMVESRERIRDLRYESEQVVPLPEALGAVAEQMSTEYPISFQAFVDGTVMSLNPLIREEIYLLGREALLNAFRHSKGTAIEMEFTFHAKWFRLRIRDDGHGIPSETLNSGGTVGHWGLSGMFERAQRMGSQFKVWNRPGSGCEVELVVPAKIAYQSIRPRRTALSLWSKASWLKFPFSRTTGDSDI